MAPTTTEYTVEIEDPADGTVLIASGPTADDADMALDEMCGVVTDRDGVELE